MKIYLLFPLSHNIIHSIWKFTLELFLAKSLNYFKQLLVLFTKYFYFSAFWLVVRLLFFSPCVLGHVTSSGQWIVSTSNLCHFPEEYLTACEILSWGLLFQEVIHKKFWDGGLSVSSGSCVAVVCWAPCWLTMDIYCEPEISFITEFLI